MPYLNLDCNYFDHPKTRRLIGLLGPMSDVLPLRLWAYCAKIHPRDGAMRGYSEPEIVSLLGITSELSTGISPVKALLRVGFIRKLKSGYACTDWRQHEGHLEAFSRRAKAGAKARWNKYRERHASSIAYVETSNAPTVPYRTKPTAPTVPDGTGIPSGTNGEQRHPKALLAETAILSKPWHFAGQFKGVRIGELPADYCQWAIKNMTKLSAEERLGCEIVLKRKQAECAR